MKVKISVVKLVEMVNTNKSLCNKNDELREECNTKQRKINELNDIIKNGLVENNRQKLRIEELERESKK